MGSIDREPRPSLTYPSRMTRVRQPRIPVRRVPVRKPARVPVRPPEPNALARFLASYARYHGVKIVDGVPE